MFINAFDKYHNNCVPGIVANGNEKINDPMPCVFAKDNEKLNSLISCILQPCAKKKQFNILFY